MINTFKIIFVLLILILLNCRTNSKLANDSKESQNLNKIITEQNLIELQGTISVRGNEPHTYLSLLTIENIDYSIVGSLKKEIAEKYQNQKVKVLGKIVKESATSLIPIEFEVVKIIEIIK